MPQVTISKGVMLAFIVPVVVVLYNFQLYYRHSAVDLQRIDAVSR